MDLYAIVDIGSNTMVLIIYQIKENKPLIIKHISTAAKLINYVNEAKYMSQEGIHTAFQVLNEYSLIAKEYNCAKQFAFITEPARIINQNELVQTLQKSDFTIDALSGEDEAKYDFYGSHLSYPEISEGIAFDVGGGSTELISFSKGEIGTAMSFPLGCVRLSHLPLDTIECHKEITKARQAYPQLNQTVKELIGIGGTCNAAGKLADAIYHCGSHVSTLQLEEIFHKIIEKDEVYLKAFHETVAASRHDVFLPGLHMILEIANIFQADKINISTTGIREGYLLKHL